jgi:ABC-type lipoprotein release transport system permease subunit
LRRMQIDENTPGSLANQEAVGTQKRWILVLFFANCLVCALGGLVKGISIPYTIWLAVQSFFFSYIVGFVSLVVLMRYGRRLIALPKITPIGLLRYCTLFAFMSVIMSCVLVYRAPYLAPWHWRDWFS